MERDALRKIVRGEIRFDEPLSKHTTLRVGGPVDALVLVRDVADLQETVRFCSDSGIACRPLGSGSNLLVRDGGVRGVLVDMRRLRALQRAGPTVVRAQAGLSTGKLLKQTLEWELGGLEFLAGVPGSVGGGLIMNAGTYLGEFKDVTRSVTTVDRSGRLIERPAADCGFEYRGSAIPRDEFLLEGLFDLETRARADMDRDVEKLRSHRRDREPKGHPNAGSFFKNPPGKFAGQLLEEAGLKGRRVGGAEVSRAHANWFVNLGGARASDFQELIELSRKEVRRQFGIHLELEVKLVGESDDA